MRLRISLFFLGLGLVAASAWSQYRVPGPGRIVAENSDVIWREAATQEAQAAVDFTIRNVGGRPVRISPPKSSCGCATPTVHPDLIVPGGSATVHVSAIVPQVGERPLLFEIETDSPATPTITLRLKLISSRRPPYIIARVDSDLAYPNARRGKTRELTVYTIEPAGPTRIPVVYCTLPGWTIEHLATSDESLEDPRLRGRGYRYRVTLAAEPPPGHFAGSVVVPDPWVEGVEHRVEIQGRARPDSRPDPLAKEGA